MTLTKLGSFALGHARKSVLLQRLPIRSTKTLTRYQSNTSAIASKNDNDDDDRDKPIKFSTSKAATWNPEASRTGVEDDDAPWFQGLSVVGSTAAFLIYFCILREENDIDEKLTRNLGEHFEGPSKENLIASQELSQKLAEEALKRRG